MYDLTQAHTSLNRSTFLGTYIWLTKINSISSDLSASKWPTGKPQITVTLFHAPMRYAVWNLNISSEYRALLCWLNAIRIPFWLPSQNSLLKFWTQFIICRFLMTSFVFSPDVLKLLPVYSYENLVCFLLPCRPKAYILETLLCSERADQ